METTDLTDDELATMRAEHAITKVLHRYAQGVDRFRLKQVRDCYWDEATDAHLPHFSGPVDDYVAWLSEVLPPMECISHQVTNILIEVDLATNSATVESYCLNALVPRPPAGEPAQRTLQCVRYLDRFERRGGEWRIRAREVARDWSWDLPG
jgi:hypothetical protein